MGIPIKMLPKIVSSNTIVGVVSEQSAKAFHLPQGVHVGVALGDHPCGVYAALKGTSESSAGAVCSFHDSSFI